MTAGNWIAVAAVLISTLGLLINWMRHGKGDAAALSAIMTRLDHLRDSVVEIKAGMKGYDTALEKHLERIVRVEQEAKSAHRRIDALDGAVRRSPRKED